jgi:hypothetical protein
MAVVVFPHPPLWLKMVMTRIAFLLGASFGHRPVGLLFEARSRPGRPVEAPTVFVGPRGLPALENLSDRPAPPCHAAPNGLKSPEFPSAGFRRQIGILGGAVRRCFRKTSCVLQSGRHRNPLHNN